MVLSPGTTVEYVVQEQRRTPEMVETFGEWRTECVSESREEAEQALAKQRETYPAFTFRLVERTVVVTEEVLG